MWQPSWKWLLGILSSNWEKTRSRSCSCNGWKPAQQHWLFGKFKWLLTNQLQKQAMLGTVTFLIFTYFLLPSREVENMIEAERPSVSTVPGLFCT